MSTRAGGASFPRLTYAITPPNQKTSVERRQAIALAHSALVRALPIDALLVYDVQDESARTAVPRPFPFFPKVDALTYAFDELDVGELPRIVYRAIAQDDEASFLSWLERLEQRRGSAIFVGAPSRELKPSLSLSGAYAACRRHSPKLSFGGVVIPERHRATGDEDARVWSKQEQGCRFFVSQTVWNPAATEALLAALRRRADAEATLAPHLIFTLSPCGSPQTLEFLQWLGVDVPRNIDRDLLGARDILARSVELAVEVFAEVYEAAAGHGIVVGCNVESVSTRPAEVEASVELTRRIHGLLASTDTALRPTAAAPSLGMVG